MRSIVSVNFPTGIPSERFVGSPGKCVSVLDHIYHRYELEAIQPLCIKNKITDTETPSSHELITLKNLAAIKKQPWISYTNLSIFESVQATENELKNSGLSLVCETSPRGRRTEISSIVDLASRLKNDVEVVLGTGWCIEAGLSQQQLSSAKPSVKLNFSTSTEDDLSSFEKDLYQSLVQDLTTGFSIPGIAKAGLIGEIVVSEEILNDGSFVQKILTKAVMAAVKTHIDCENCPLIFKIELSATVRNLSLFSRVARTLTDIIGLAENEQRGKVDFSKVSFAGITECFLISEAQSFPESLDRILQFAKSSKEFTIILGSFGFPVASEVMKDINQVIIFVERFLTEDLSNRLVFGGNIRFKTDLREYGGDGFHQADENRKFLRNVLMHRMNKDDAEQIDKHLDQIFCSNALRFLGFHEEREVVVVQRKLFMTCDFCQKEKEMKDEHDFFGKDGLKFCSIKCLRAYQKTGAFSKNNSKGDDGSGGGKRRANASSAW